MLAVGIGAKEVELYLSKLSSSVKVAAYNSSQSVTLSGDAGPVSQIAETLKARGIFCRILKTGGNAYHSHHMAAIGKGYQDSISQALSEITLSVEERWPSFSARWFSSVSTKEVSSQTRADVFYWRQNLESPVLFVQAVEAMMESCGDDLDVMLEIGPHPALSGPLKQIFTGSQASGFQIPTYISTLVREQDALVCMLRTAGHLFLQDQPIDLTAVNAMDELEKGEHVLVHGRVCVDLPGYAYHYGPSIYHENRFNKERRNRVHLRHDLLGARQPGSARACPSWRNMLRLKDVPWLGDHKVSPRAPLSRIMLTHRVLL